MYVYYLEEGDLDDINLMLASGEPFTLSDDNSNLEKKKRFKKHMDKEEQKGIDVTDAV